ncbi:MAG: DRTGG domain-containing protein [Eubacteriales bacterium]
MKIQEVAAALQAEVLSCHDKLICEVHAACGSDMMSDVLAFVKDQAVLLTGLINSQVIRTAEMMDIHCIVFVRNKVPTDDMIALAADREIVLMTTKKHMFESCGILYQSGLNQRNETAT